MDSGGSILLIPETSMVSVAASPGAIVLCERLAVACGAFCPVAPKTGSEQNAMNRQQKRIDDMRRLPVSYDTSRFPLFAGFEQMNAGILGLERFKKALRLLLRHASFRGGRFRFGLLGSFALLLLALVELR